MIAADQLDSRVINTLTRMGDGFDVNNRIQVKESKFPYLSTHRKPEDRSFVAKWAASLFDDPENTVVLDTETTGLRKTDEIVQISVRDLTGKDLCTSLVSLTKRKRIPKDATDIHGIRTADLEGQPTYLQLSPLLKKILKGKRIIAYNAEFDLRLVIQSFLLDGGYEPDPEQWHCAMIAYAAFIGEWNDYHDNYRWQKLGGSHDAGDDVTKTIEVLREMADFHKEELIEEQWQKTFKKKESDCSSLTNQIELTKSKIKKIENRDRFLNKLESSGIPAGVVFMVASLVLSLVVLFGFGSILLSTLTFCLGSGLGVWLFLTGGPEKESAIAKQRDKAKRLKEILIAKKKELRDWEQTKPMPLVAEI